MNRLIAFTGKAGCGKTTAAQYLSDKHGHIIYSFAEKMKEGLVSMLDLDKDCIFGTQEQKEAPIPHLSDERAVTGRLLLQTLGTDWGRDSVDSDIWLYSIKAKWATLKISHFKMVLHDLRFNNEAAWVRSQGGIVISIDDRPLATPHADLHKSEKGIDEDLISASVLNHKSGLKPFHQNIENALGSLTKATDLYVAKPPPPLPALPLAELIVQWADGIFPNRTINDAIKKLMLEEIPEYLMAQDDPMELADLGILIYDIANLAGVDLDKAIREKMEINKNRIWATDEKTGLLHHVEDK